MSYKHAKHATTNGVQTLAVSPALPSRCSFARVRRLRIYSWQVFLRPALLRSGTSRHNGAILVDRNGSHVENVRRLGRVRSQSTRKPSGRKTRGKHRCRGRRARRKGTWRGYIMNVTPMAPISARDSSARVPLRAGRLLLSFLGPPAPACSRRSPPDRFSIELAPP